MLCTRLSRAALPPKIEVGWPPGLLAVAPGMPEHIGRAGGLGAIPRPSASPSLQIIDPLPSPATY